MKVNFELRIAPSRQAFNWAHRVLAVLAVGFFASVANATEANDPVQWRVENDDKVIGNGEYQLHNLRRRTLNLTSQLGAIWLDVCSFPCITAPAHFSLSWHGSSGGHFVFARHDKNDRSSILESEVVALYNTKTKVYLIAKQKDGKPAGVGRTYRPTYEWALHGRRGTDFALYNTQVGGYLMLGRKDTALAFSNCSAGNKPKTDPQVACDKNWQATAGGASTTTPTPTAQPVVGARAVVRTGAGLCLDVHAPDIAKDGALVQAWSCHGQPNQLWSYDRTAGVLRVSSGLCLDVHAPDMRTNGGRVQVWACSGQPQQQWTPMPDGTLRNRGGLCLDVHAPDQSKDGARVQVWACHGAQSQWFGSAAF